MADVHHIPEFNEPLAELALLAAVTGKVILSFEYDKQDLLWTVEIFANQTKRTLQSETLFDAFKNLSVSISNE